MHNSFSQQRDTPLVEVGSTIAYACQYDQRFSYYAYVPRNYEKDSEKSYSVAVIIHGNERAAQKFRGAFKDFAEATNTIILAPLFPGGIIDPNDIDNYKLIKFHDIRFDEVLLSMIEEISNKYRISKEKFLLHGFSAGGQFALRFLYLHPHRLLGVSIGAPGRVTYLDESLPWYLGIRDFEQQFGTPIRLEALKKVPVHMVIGSEDNGGPTYNPAWDQQIDPYGCTRTERLRALRDNYLERGIAVRYDEVMGVGHHGFKLLSPVKEFFTRLLLNQG